MADICSPLKPCDGLDGRMLLQRAVYGPQFGFVRQPSLLGVSTPGAGVRPYLNLRMALNWKPVGLCLGPPASVMGLAPGEVVTVGIRTRTSRSFSKLVSDAAESSFTSSHSARHIFQQGTQPVPTSPGSGGGSGSDDWLETVISLVPIAIAAFGSFLDDALSVVEDVAGVVGDVVGGVAGAVGDLVGQVIGGGPQSSPVVQTWSMTDEVLDTVTHTESQSHLRQSMVTTSEESEQTIKRTFGNPYMDRSLQLRFIPVFSQFQVKITLVQVVPGLVVHFAEPAATAAVQVPSVAAQAGRNLLRTAAAERAPWQRPAATALYVTDQTGDDDAVRRPVREVLRNLGGRRRTPALLEHGLSWSRTEIHGNGVHVPLDAAENVISAWRLKGDIAKKFSAALALLSAEQLTTVFPARTRTVSVFAGTHVEAVPGSCVLPEIPADLKVVFPGETQYLAKKV